MAAPKAIVSALVDKAFAISQSIAQLLATAEGVLEHGTELDEEPGVSPLLASPDQLVRTAGDEWLARFRQALAAGTPDPSPAAAEASEVYQDACRLARLIFQSWKAGGGRGARRPDVLAVTAQFLANPAVPYTAEIVRFSIVLVLRSLYNVPFNLESLDGLRKAYGELKVRFEHQQSRRQRRSANRYEGLLIDLLAMERWIYRSLTRETARYYYESFSRSWFGVEDEHRDFGTPHGPQLDGVVPDFARILNLAFNQPVGVPGFDDVTDGLMAAIPAPEGEPWMGGGLVTLIAGPPGSGKTSLCLSITSRMAELGSVVGYIATEEKQHSLEAKRTAISTPLANLLWPGAPPSDGWRGDWTIIPGSAFTSLQSLTRQLAQELREAEELREVQKESPSSDEVNGRKSLYLVFPRVIVIDSMTALLQRGSERAEGGQSFATPQGRLQPGRRELGRLLNEWRELGICVFLVGALQDCEDEGLAYLVDNVFILDQDDKSSPRHPIRTFNVRKTRLQSSSRGVHVFHLSTREGCSISPSLHAVLRRLKDRPVVASDPDARAVLWSRAGHPQQLRLFWPESSSAESDLLAPGAPEGNAPITIRSRSQILLYGRGSTGKARLAMAVAFEPRHPVNAKDWPEYVARHAVRQPDQFDKRHLDRARVLVISFLYGKDYYEKIAVELFSRRFNESTPDVAKHVSILDFYPGYVDPETLVARVRRHLHAAQLQGHPFTTVILDGVHNLLLQFPLLEHEPLLWPTLFRQFRAEGIDTVTTFTFFHVAVIDRTEAPILGGAEHIFFQLLVSNCDYTFLVERPAEMPPRAGRNWVKLHLASSIDGFGKEPPAFWWDPATLTYKQQPPDKP